MTNRSRITQELANAFPGESAARRDEQSFTQAFLNVLGNQVEPLVKVTQELGGNRFLDTANVSALDVMYRVDLSASFAFDTDETDPSHLEFIEPTVTATVSGTTTVSVTTPEENTLLSLSQSPPTRISLNMTTSGVDSLYSGLAINSFDNDSILDPITPNFLRVDLSDGTQYLRIEDPNQVRRAHIQLNGETEWGLQISEPVVVLHDGTRTTIHEFSTANQISSIDVIPLDEATIVVRDHDFNQSAYEDFWQLEEGVNRRDKVVFWKLDYTDSKSLLRKQTYIAQDLADRISGRELDTFTEKTLVLRDASDLDIHLLDIAQKPYTDLLYAVSENTLYVYELGIPIIPHILLNKLRETPDRLAILELSNEWPDLGETIDIDTYFARPINTIVRHKISIRYPDATVSGVLDGTFYPHTADYWNREEINDRRLRGTEQLTVNEVGDYTVTLESRYKDGRIDYDQRIIRIGTLIPVATFSLTGVLPAGTTAAGIDFDSRHRLRILLSNQDRAFITEYHDYMVIDYDQKQLYLKENYLKVRVIP